MAVHILADLSVHVHELDTRHRTLARPEKIKTVLFTRWSTFTCPTIRWWALNCGGKVTPDGVQRCFFAVCFSGFYRVLLDAGLAGNFRRSRRFCDSWSLLERLQMHGGLVWDANCCPLSSCALIAERGDVCDTRGSMEISEAARYLLRQVLLFHPHIDGRVVVVTSCWKN